MKHFVPEQMQPALRCATSPQWQVFGVEIAQERERRALAEKLHEDLCQVLAMANLRLSSLHDCGLDAAVVHEIKEVEGLIAMANDCARSVARQLSPPVLHAVGLAPALEWLGEDIEHRYGLKVIVYDDGAPKPLDELSRTTLYLAARELLINTARHARAACADLSTIRLGSRLTLAVGDNGCGFDYAYASAWPTAVGKNGLRWLRERIALIGGQMNVNSHAGRGTHIALSAPLCNMAQSDVR